MSRSTCPDCNRWRCVCLAFEAEDIQDNGPASGEAAARKGFDSSPAQPIQPVRTSPPPTYVREALRGLRAEFAERAARTARTYGRAAP